METPPINKVMTEPYKILPLRQQQFFVRAAEFSFYLAGQIENKRRFMYGDDSKVSSTLLFAEILLQSRFGEHPLSAEKYPEKDGKWANNLALLELDESWTGKWIKYDKVIYKSFKTWLDFATNWTDILAFRKGEVTPYLLDRLVNNQYTGDIKLIIDSYHLKDYEVHGIEETE
mgnify:FL=1